MPQLSTIYIFLVYTWTWTVLCLLVQKTKNLPINKTPTTPSHAKPKELTPILPWT